MGTISVQFPLSDELFEYTCFLIDSNVIVTLASNLENKNRGGKAKLITTSFAKENITWENIFIQGEGKLKEKKDEKKDENQKKSFDNLSSKLAVIILCNNFFNEWLGVESGKLDDYRGRYIYAVFSFTGEKNNNTIITTDEKENIKQIKLRKVLVNDRNIFSNASQNGDEIIKQSPGSPIYYRDNKNGFYVVAIINEFFEFQYFDKNTILFLADMANKGRQLMAKINNYNNDNITQMYLEGYNLGPSDIKYLNNFDLKNLIILDINSNSINSKGVFYLSQGKFSSVEFLNLSNNNIGNEGLNHLANCLFSKLNRLYLSHNHITSEGIKYLVKADFINNLSVLLLSENRKIGDKGIMIMKEYKEWTNLTELNLNMTGMADIGLDYLYHGFFPKLKKLYIIDNNFTDKDGRATICFLVMKKIKVIYKKGQKEDEVYVIDTHFYREYLGLSKDYN